MADSKPSETIRPKPELMNGVIALPSAMISKPPIKTARGPKRSAKPPAVGKAAGNRLDRPPGELADGQRQTDRGEAILNPVETISGLTNNPSDWRTPIVTIKIPAAASVVPRTSGFLKESNIFVRAPDNRL